MIKAPNLPKILNNGYAKLVASGFDTFIEVYKCIIPVELEERLTRLREQCADRDGGRAEGMTIDFGGTEFQIDPYRRKGKPFLLKNDQYTIDFMYTKWNIKVTYSAPVLWSVGIEKARENLIDILLKEVKADGADWTRVSAAHYAFDFYAPDFNSEMRPEILHDFVCTSGVKKRVQGKLDIDYDFIMQGARGETVTIGTKKNLQIQIYNKTTEIREASGKFWMYDLWEKSGLEIDRENPPVIWRVEVRMQKEYLKNRDKESMRIYECFLTCVFELIADALERRRLTRPKRDTNKSRWPIHPLWTAIFDACEHPPERITLGRIIEKTKEEMEDILTKGIDGTARSFGTLDGKYDRNKAEAMLKDVLDRIEADPEHEIKCIRAAERYKFINSPK